MNIGVEVLKESVIRVQSQLNDWMDCVFVVSKDDEEKAREVLEKAWDSFWEDGDGWCYGKCRYCIRCILRRCGGIRTWKNTRTYREA